MPRQDRSPDDPGLEAVVHQRPQGVLARIVVGRRLGSEPGPHLGVLVQRRAFLGLPGQPPHAAALKRAPPEGLAGAAHSGDERAVRLHRLDMGAGQIHVVGGRGLAVARAFRQLGERGARLPNVDCAPSHYAAPSPPPTAMSLPKRSRNRA